MKKFLVSLALSLLTACATFGLPTPESYDERLAAGYVSATNVVSTASALLSAEKIGSKDAKNAREAAEAAREGLDVADSIRSTNPTGAQSRLDVSIASLDALKKYLGSRK